MKPRFEMTARQKRAAHKDFARKGTAIWHRVGAGKTRITYRSFAMVAKRVEGVARFVVVCRREAFFDWKNEAAKCGLNWTFIELEHEEDLYSGMVSKRPVVYLISHGKLARFQPLLVSEAYLFSAIAYD